MKSILIVDAPYLRSMAKDRGRFDIIKLATKLSTFTGSSFDEMHYHVTTIHPIPQEMIKYHRWLESRKGIPKITLKEYSAQQYTQSCPVCCGTVSRLLRDSVTLGIETFLLSSSFQNLYDRYMICAGATRLGQPIDYVRRAVRKEVKICTDRGSAGIFARSGDRDIIWFDDIWDDIRSS